MIELSEEEVKAIKHEMTLYEDPGAAAIDALKIVQDHRGWVSDDALYAAAQVLDVSPSRLEGVATFYNLIFRHPVGRHVIMICDSISCFLTGYEEIVSHLKTSLGINFGETTEDGRFTLLPICCLGNCHNGPAMRVGENYHGQLTPERVDEILAEYK